jgi:hypothetical protein
MDTRRTSEFYYKVQTPRKTAAFFTEGAKARLAGFQGVRLEMLGFPCMLCKISPNVDILTARKQLLLISR